MRSFVVKFSNTTAKDWKGDRNCLYCSIALPLQTNPTLISKTEHNVRLLYKDTILYPLVTRDEGLFEDKAGFYLSRLFDPVTFNKYQRKIWYYKTDRPYVVKLHNVESEIAHRDICIPNQEWVVKNVTTGQVYTKLLEVFQIKMRLNDKIYRPVIKLEDSNIKTRALNFRASSHRGREIFFGTKQDAEAAIPYILESSYSLKLNQDYIKIEVCKKYSTLNWVETKVKDMNNTYYFTGHFQAVARNI